MSNIERVDTDLSASGKAFSLEPAFHSLALRYLDAACSEEEVQHLVNELAASEEKRAAFASLCVELGVLSEACCVRNEPESDGEFQQAECESPFVVLSRIGGAGWLSGGPGSYFRVSAMLLACASLLVGGAVGWTLRRASVPSPLLQVDNGRLNDAPVAYLTSVNGCTWGGSSSNVRAVGSSLQLGDEITLHEGIAELSVASGELVARLSLEGPVAMTLTPQGMPSLRYGRMTLKIDGFSHEQYAFEAPFGRMVVAGSSEIGVCSLGAAAEVHAFRGKVAIESLWLSELTDEAEETQALQGTVSVRSGEALRIEGMGSGSVQVIRTAADRTQFLPEVPMDSDPLIVGAEYIKEIRQSAPVAYWRFEGHINGVIPNEVQDRFHGRTQRIVEWSGPNGNRSLQLGMSVDPGAVIVDDASWDEVLAKDFSIEAWIKPSHFHRGAMIGFVGEFNTERQKNAHGILLETCGVPHWHKDKCLRFLHRPKSVDDVIRGNLGVSCFSNVDYAPRRWQHVVAQRRGNRLQLYLNGKLVQMKHDWATTPKGMQLVIGQLYSETTFRFFTGQMDEVAIYDRALSKSEVANHYHLLRPVVIDPQGA